MGIWWVRLLAAFQWRRALERVLTVGVVLLASACGKWGGEAKVDANAVEPRTFRLLASAEVKEIETALRRAAAAADLDLTVQYASTTELLDRLHGAESFDAVLPTFTSIVEATMVRRPLDRAGLFRSPIVVAVRGHKAEVLGWDKETPTWSEIAAAAGAGKFRYAMPNPGWSADGLSALFSMVESVGPAPLVDVAGPRDFDEVAMRQLLRAQAQTAGSATWLAGMMQRDGVAVDGMIVSEAVAASENVRLDKQQRFLLVYPRGGSIGLDYSMLLLREDARSRFERLKATLLDKRIQSEVVKLTSLRGVADGAQVPEGLEEAPADVRSFLGTQDLVELVLTKYQVEWRRPATSIVVLAMTESAKGARREEVLSALSSLLGRSDGRRSSLFTVIRPGERLGILPFTDQVGDVVWVEAPMSSNEDPVAQLKLPSDRESTGSVAIFSALGRAQELAEAARRADPERLVTIVLIADKENGAGSSLYQFQKGQGSGNPARIFPVAIGEASHIELEAIAIATGGKVFDARKVGLTAAVREIRGYQ